MPIYRLCRGAHGTKGQYGLDDIDLGFGHNNTHSTAATTAAAAAKRAIGLK